MVLMGVSVGSTMIIPPAGGGLGVEGNWSGEVMMSGHQHNPASQQVREEGEKNGGVKMDATTINHG